MTSESQILIYEDGCLIAITDGYPLPTDALLALPPWRAVLLARVADKAGIGLEQGTLDQLVAEAWAVGGAGRLGEWWRRSAAGEGSADGPAADQQGQRQEGQAERDEVDRDRGVEHGQQEAESGEDSEHDSPPREG